MSKASATGKNGGGDSAVSISTKDRVTFDSSSHNKETGSTRRNKNDSVVSQQSLVEGPTSVVASSWAPQRPPHVSSDAASASMSSTIPSRTPRQRNDTRKGRKRTPPPPPPPQEEASLTERLGNSALSSTLEILKLMGGVGWSTTGVLLSPSLELTKALLPHLLGGIADYLSQVSPQRLKDWFRIVSASVHHLVAVIVSTGRGAIFRRKIARVGGDIVDVVSSESSRQTLMDGMACFIKLSEALHTPEFKAFLDHAGVFGCRLVDAASNSQNKKLIHDLAALAWSAVELANDPATTVAFAEVAAYLCYALEMEDAAIHAIAKERSEINRTAAERRRERDIYQIATYQEQYLLEDPNATVEEVILSAFGVIQRSVEDSKLQTGAFSGNDIPGSVVVGSDDEESERQPSGAVTPPPQTATTNKMGTTGSGAGDDEYEDFALERPARMGDHDVDVVFLREKITKHSQSQRLEQLKAGTEQDAVVTSTPKVALNRQTSVVTDDCDDGKRDIEELSAMVNEEEARRQGPTTLLQYEQGSEPQHDDLGSSEPMPTPTTSRQNRSVPLDGESPVTHFYRVLDEILKSERKVAMASVASNVEQNGKDSGKGLDARVLKNRLQEMRSEKRSSIKQSSLHPSVAKFIRENRVVVFTGMLCVVLLGLMFFTFGCYGMYMFAFPPRLNPFEASVGSGRSEIHVPIVIHDDKPLSRRQDEYVIRIVREIVHVNSKGEVLQVQTRSSDEL